MMGGGGRGEGNQNNGRRTEQNRKGKGRGGEGRDEGEERKERESQGYSTKACAKACVQYLSPPGILPGGRGEMPWAWGVGERKRKTRGSPLPSSLAGFFFQSLSLWSVFGGFFRCLERGGERQHVPELPRIDLTRGRKSLRKP